MKHIGKIISFILTVTILSALMCTVSADREITVFMDNERIEFDVSPMMINNRTMVPMRAIFEKLGAEVLWDDATKTVSAYKDMTYVSITIGAPYMSTWSGTIELDTPAIIVDNRTLIPLRAVSEAFDCDVQWDGATRTVNIYNADFIDFSQETSTQTVVEVSNATELLNSIGSNKKIILTADYYNLSDAVDVKNSFVEKQEYSGGYTIKNAVNMTIEGNAEIAINDIYADVLRFEKCGNITLSNLTIGHTNSLDAYQCEGAVVRLKICSNITVNNCNLYGCGAFGIRALNVENLKVENSKIYDCSYTGIWLTDGSDATVNNTEFFDSTHDNGFIRIDESKIDCNNCKIYNIVCNNFDGSFIDSWSSENNPAIINFNNCTFANNVFIDIANKTIQNLTFTDCVFENNTGSLEHPYAIYNKSTEIRVSAH